MAKKGQKFIKYDLKFKEKVLKERRETGIPIKLLGEKYKIPYKTIDTWERIYRRDGGLNKAKRGRPIKTEDEQTDYKEKYEILKKFQEFLEEVDREKK